MTAAEEEGVREEARQVVAFDLAGESYAVGTGVVNTVLRTGQITRVARAPEFVEGIINVRGSIVPVVDLRKLFGLGVSEETNASRIMVVETSTGLIGLMVDGVTETLLLGSEAIELLSPLVTTADSQYLRGVAKVDGRLIILLEIEKIFRESETQALAEVTSAEAQAETEGAAAALV